MTAKGLDILGKLNLFRYGASYEQEILLGLLISESVAKWETHEKHCKLRQTSFDFVLGLATSEELCKTRAICFNDTDIDAGQFQGVYTEAVCAAWRATSEIEGEITSFKQTNKYLDLLFSENGPVHMLIPDFNRIPSLEEMLILYPTAVEVARNLFVNVK